jgi:hypothetical protein
MSNWQLDANGDLDIVGNNVVVTEGRDAIRQRLQCRLRFFYGEWFLDTTLGVPYFEEILVKGPRMQIIQDIFKNVILETDGITGLTRFDFDYDSDDRKLSVTFSATSIDGDIDFSQEFPI